MSAPETPQREFPRVALFLDRSGGANPADAAGVNINKIMAAFRKNGTLPNVANNNPLFGDFTFPEDIHSMREAVHQAEDRFMELPADVRTVCDNDWVEFITKFQTPEGREQLSTAGLNILNTPPIEPAPISNTPAPTPPIEPDPEPDL